MAQQLKVCPNVEVGKLYEVTNFIQRDMDVTPLGFQNYETPWGNIETYHF